MSVAISVRKGGAAARFLSSSPGACEIFLKLALRKSQAPGPRRKPALGRCPNYTTVAERL